MFEVWDIPWQGTSTLLKQKCQPKGQSAAKKQNKNQIIDGQIIVEEHSYGSK